MATRVAVVLSFAFKTFTLPSLVAHFDTNAGNGVVVFEKGNTTNSIFVAYDCSNPITLGTNAAISVNSHSIPMSTGVLLGQPACGVAGPVWGTSGNLSAKFGNVAAWLDGQQVTTNRCDGSPNNVGRCVLQDLRPTPTGTNILQVIGTKVSVAGYATTSYTQLTTPTTSIPTTFVRPASLQIVVSGVTYDLPHMLITTSQSQTTFKTNSNGTNGMHDLDVVDALELSGVNSILGRSVVVYNVATMAAFSCATIVPANRYQKITAMFSGILVGEVTLMQEIGPLGVMETALSYHLTSQAANAQTGLTWSIRVNYITDTTTCVTAGPQHTHGNLTGKHGVIPSLVNNATRGVLHDLTLPLYGPESVTGRSLVIYGSDGVALGCANLGPKLQRTSVNFADIAGSLVSGTVTLTYDQASGVLEGYAGGLKYTTPGTAATTNKWAVHVSPVYNDGADATAQKCKSGGIMFNPTGVTLTNSLYGTRCTGSAASNWNQCAMGDFGTRWGNLNIMTTTDTYGGWKYFTETQTVNVEGGTIVGALEGVDGRSIVIMNGTNNLACGTLGNPVQVLLAFEGSVSNMTGDIVLSQAGEGNPVLWYHPQLVANDASTQYDMYLILGRPNSMASNPCVPALDYLSTTPGRITFTTTITPAWFETAADAFTLTAGYAVVLKGNGARATEMCSAVSTSDEKVIVTSFVGTELNGELTLIQSSSDPANPTTIGIRLTIPPGSTATGTFPWSINEKSLGNDWSVDTPLAERCRSSGGVFDPTQIGNTNTAPYRVGDLTSAHGHLAVTGVQKWFVSTQVTLTGPNSVLGRTIVIGGSSAMIVCARIGQVEVIASNVLNGQITLRQEFSGVSTAAQQSMPLMVDVTPLANSAAVSLLHNWHVHVNGVPDPTSLTACADTGGHFNPLFKLYSSPVYNLACDGGNEPTNVVGCEVGDLAGNFGTLTIGQSPQLFASPLHLSSDESRPQLFGQASVAGRSIVIHAANKTSPRFACGALGRAAYASFPSFQDVSGTVRLQRGLPPPLNNPNTSATSVVVDVTLKGNLASPFALSVYETAVPADGDCEVVGDIYDPYAMTADNPLCSAARPLQCQLGNISSKQGMLDLKNSPRSMFFDAQLPLSGPQSVVGRSLVLTDAQGKRVACATIRDDLPVYVPTTTTAAPPATTTTPGNGTSGNNSQISEGSGSGTDDSSDGGAIAGAVIGSLVGVALIVFIVYWFGFRERDSAQKTPAAPSANPATKKGGVPSVAPVGSAEEGGSDTEMGVRTVKSAQRGDDGIWRQVDVAVT